MQQRRFRPGDVLDDYCPRERRITDHAIVAMIDDHIKQTRCCVCDAEHEFKDGKVPPQRRKTPQPALFTQVLEGLQGPQTARLAHHSDDEPELDALPNSHDVVAELSPLAVEASPSSNGHPSGNGNGPGPTVDALIAQSAAVAAITEPAPVTDHDLPPAQEEGPVRRSLIRATLPRPEGHPPP